MDILRLIDKVILNALKTVTIAAFIMLTLLVTANVVVRFVPLVSLHWFDEIIELLFTALVFYGAAALWISQGHIAVGSWIENSIRNVRLKHFYRLLIELMVLGFVLIFLFYSTRLTTLARDVTNVFAIPKSFLYSCLPISGVIMAAYSVRNIIVEVICWARPKEGNN